MIRSLARARSRCRFGGRASLVNRSDTCAIVGCGCTIYYLGAPATGGAYHVLIDRPALLDGVGDPVGLPFRSRWHAMVPVGLAPLSSPAPANVIELYRHLATGAALAPIGADERIT